MDLGQSIRTGVKWLLVGSTGNRILEFAFGVILARLLLPADFGLIITIQVFTGFVGMLTSGGMGQSLIRAKEADEDDFNAVFTLQLTLGVLIYLGFFLTSRWFAVYFENPLYEDLLQVSALAFLMRPFAAMRIAWLNRQMDFKKRSVVGIIAGVLTGVSSTLMASVGMGVWSLTLSGLVGAFGRNILLARVTPLRLRLNVDLATMRRHGAYGVKITINDFLTYLRMHGVNLILSKFAGPAFLGLFNKADSLFRTPAGMLGSPVSQTVFRAMSKVQDDLDQTKYMFYRVITLLTVYTLPFFVGLWWVAEPFIGVVYGDKWLPAAEPLRILVVAGLFRIIGRPCGVLLAAQNRLTQEIIAQIAILIVTISACLVGLNWGLEGVAWGFVASHAFGALYIYILAYRTLTTRIADLFKAVAPGLLLNAMLFLVLALTDSVTSELRRSDPVLYLLLIVISGSSVYAAAFFLLPIPALRSEAARWSQKINGGLSIVYKAVT